MNITIYILIFFCKIIENMLFTLRIIIINNNKKILGALLQFANTMVWVLGTSLTVINITEDIFKIFVFALGSAVGSYFGSYIEEKLALGNNLIICISKYNLSKFLKENDFAVTVLKSNEDIFTHMIIVPRYKLNNLINIIKTKDNKALITKENTALINGGKNYS